MQDILAITKAFIKQCNTEQSFHPEYEYGCSDIFEKYIDCWFFSFTIVPKTIQKGEKPMFGGAPGFIISKANKHNYYWLGHIQ